MLAEFIKIIETRQSDFGLNLSEDKIRALFNYYEIVQKHNEILHLVAPCSAEEFATRHILESLTILEFLPPNAKFADIGAGAGLPSDSVFDRAGRFARRADRIEIKKSEIS